jgi:hypothetical protein
MNKDDIIVENGKYVIPVPPGIRYMSEWEGFNLDFFGDGAYIIDKQIPGCGFTEYCLTSKEFIILTSPRKILLENKEDQHKGDIFYAKNECEDNLLVDKDLSKLKNVPKRQTRTREEEQRVKEINNAKFIALENSLIDYIFRMNREGKPFKIIVTYDSFKHVKRIFNENDKIKDLFPFFKIIVDEFQSIFVDSRFKASTEFGFLEELKTVRNKICFVSATPMMDKYLKQLDYFNSLPYFEFNWGLKDPTRVMKPELKVRKTKSINSEIKRIIGDYKAGRFEFLRNPVTNEIVYSKEAVFYVNSVNNILSIIKSEKLKPEEVNILCSGTSDNDKKLEKKLGNDYKIGKVPLRGQPHKMFTFCTRTVYLGADFYSTCARTFILSDANIDSLAVDISLDLPQIMGRQRLVENPWKNHAEFYFKNLGDGKDLTEEDFNRRIREKVDKTENKIAAFMEMSDKGKASVIDDFIYIARTLNYEYDYVSVNYVYETPTLAPNKLVLIAEQRAFDIQQVDYKDRFAVFSSLKKSDDVEFDKMTNFIDSLRDIKTPKALRLKALCESSYSDDIKKMIAQQVSEEFDKLYNFLGPDRCKALSYNTTLMYRELNDMLMPPENVISEMYSYFEVGKRYTNEFIKGRVREIYDHLKLSKTPKAVDILEFFEVKKVSIILPDKKKVNGLELLKKKYNK